MNVSGRAFSKRDPNYSKKQHLLPLNYMLISCSVLEVFSLAGPMHGSCCSINNRT